MQQEISLAGTSKVLILKEDWIAVDNVNTLFTIDEFIKFTILTFLA